MLLTHLGVTEGRQFQIQLLLYRLLVVAVAVAENEILARLALVEVVGQAMED
jgi:hypothetical protein